MINDRVNCNEVRVYLVEVTYALNLTYFLDMTKVSLQKSVLPYNLGGGLQIG